MISVATHIIAFCLGGIIGACGVGLLFHALTLRRQLKAAQKALEARETAPQTEGQFLRCRYCGRDDGSHPDKCPTHPANWTTGQITPSDDAPRFSGIGPSDIASRELYEREKARVDSTPKFASPSVLNPDLSDIREAAREATNGGKPN